MAVQLYWTPSILIREGYLNQDLHIFWITVSLSCLWSLSLHHYSKGSQRIWYFHMGSCIASLHMRVGKVGLAVRIWAWAWDPLVLPHTTVSSRSCQPDRRVEWPLKSAAESSTLRRFHLRMAHGSPTGRIHGSRSQAVEVGVLPITIIPSGLLEEFVLSTLSLWVSRSWLLESLYFH